MTTSTDQPRVRDAYTLRHLTVQPGTVQRSWLKMLELADQSLLEIPIIIIHGKESGETVYIGAGAHGDEINTVLALLDALNRIDPDQVHGTIVAVPVQNPYGYLHRRRLFDLNQSDSETLNLHRVFPGVPDGDPHQRMAHVLYRLMKDSGATFHFDLHTGTTGSYCPPHTFLPTKQSGEAARQAFEAARVFNAGLIVQANEGVYAHPTMPHTVLASEGLPVLGTELGQGGYVDESLVALGTRGILDVLRHRQVLQDGVKVVPVDQTVLGEVIYVRANRGGMIEFLVEPGEEVSKGQAIAVITDVFGEVLETVSSPVSGHVINTATPPTIHEGERVSRIGVPV